MKHRKNSEQDGKKGTRKKRKEKEKESRWSNYLRISKGTSQREMKPRNRKEQKEKDQTWS